MTVDELITELMSQPKDAEIGYEVGSDHISLLIGEDEHTGTMIDIKNPHWR